MLTNNCDDNVYAINKPLSVYINNSESDTLKFPENIKCQWPSNLIIKDFC